MQCRSADVIRCGIPARLEYSVPRTGKQRRLTFHTRMQSPRHQINVNVTLSSERALRIAITLLHITVVEYYYKYSTLLLSPLKPERKNKSRVSSPCQAWRRPCNLSPPPLTLRLAPHFVVLHLAPQFSFSFASIFCNSFQHTFFSPAHILQLYLSLFTSVQSYPLIQPFRQSNRPLLAVRFTDRRLLPPAHSQNLTFETPRNTTLTTISLFTRVRLRRSVIPINRHQ